MTQPEHEQTWLAVCVVGAARSLGHTLAHETLRRHVVESFGAHRTEFMFHLKTEDHRGDPRKGTGAMLSVDVDQLLRTVLYVTGNTSAATQSVLPEMQPDPTDPRILQLSTERARIIIDQRPNDDVYHSMLNSNYNRTGACTEDWYSPVIAAGGIPGQTVYASLLQLAMTAECGEWFAERERQLGRKFNYVLKARPDLVYSTPLEPYCLFSESGTAIAQHDWALFAGRQLAYNAFVPMFREAMECGEGAQRPVHESPEHHMWRGLQRHGWHPSFFVVNTYLKDLDVGNSSTTRGIAGAVILRPNRAGFPVNVCKMVNSVLGNNKAGDPVANANCLRHLIGGRHNSVASFSGNATAAVESEHYFLPE